MAKNMTESEEWAAERERVAKRPHGVDSDGFGLVWIAIIGLVAAGCAAWLMGVRL